MTTGSVTGLNRGHAEDGLSVTVPVALLNRLPRHRFEWLVPGMLVDKCTALLKSLPKSLRKKLVPIPDQAARFVASSKVSDQPLLAVLADWLEQQHQLQVSAEDWQLQQLDDFYRINYRIVDEQGVLLAQGRELGPLLAQFAGRVSETLTEQVGQHFQQDQIQHWDFGELPESVQFTQAGVNITSYPALIDRGDSVAIELRDYPQQAASDSRRGLIRLFMLQLPQQMKTLRKELLQGNQLQLHFASTGQQRQQWLDDLLQAVFYRCFLAERPLPRDAQAFANALQQGRETLFGEAMALNELLVSILTRFSAIRKTLRQTSQLAWVASIADINQQLALLFAAGFIIDTPAASLAQYPRYLQAIEQRLEKLRGNFPRDRQLTRELETAMTRLQSRWTEHRSASPVLQEYRWLLEEYRVSLFAQSLGTLQPASQKRLDKLWQQVQQEQDQVSA